MKQKKDYTITALLIPFLIAVLANLPGCYTSNDVKESNLNRHYESDISNIQPVHQCSDTAHLNCDGECECDGMECSVIKTDYQINLHNDTVWIYDGNRFVGSYISNWNNQMDTILLTDNQ